MNQCFALVLLCSFFKTATKFLTVTLHESHVAIPFFNFDFVAKSVQPTHQHEARRDTLMRFPFVNQ